ncbi:MAG TPA: NAD(P)-binding domain-containing protein [Candidatus Krumholzibacteria bacterium]|nr:NAD(P)-binding domain-containing protein [Candidatus Krumholzibacteria bacterium]
MKVGILGSGEVAKALAAGFLKYGHGVTMGTREPQKLAGFAKQHTGVRTGSVADAAAFGEVLVLAVKGNAAADVLRAAGPKHLAGKTVIDPTNAIMDAPPIDGVIQSFTGPNESLMEQLQAEFPAAHFVKAFSCIGSDTMVDPKFKEGKPTMFIAGNNAAAKKIVGDVCTQFGWEVADMGTAVAARAIEPLAVLWCIPGFRENKWGLRAFKMLT